jgi:hypothetical protein
MTPVAQSCLPVPGLAAVSEAVQALESKFDLLGRRIDGTAYWERVRFAVHRRLLVESGSMWAPETATSTVSGRLALLAKALLASVHRSAAGSLPKCEVLLVGGGRRVWDPTRGWHSPYWEPLASGCPFEPIVLEFQGGAPWSQSAEGVPTFFLDRFNALARLRRITGSFPRLPRTEAEILREVGVELEDRTGVTLDLLAMIRDDLGHRETTLPAWKAILDRIDPKVVVVECSYDKHSLVEGAQDKGVPVIEIQHGVVSRHHFGYHFPEQSGTPKVFPDWFLSWGDYWKTAADFPLRADRIVVTGFPRFDRERRTVENLEPSDTILFLSQTMLGHTLSRFAVELADLGLRDRVVYRLHPLEVTGWRDRYPWLAASGVRISGPDLPLYRDLRAAAIHVGTFSTSLFEGLGLGASVFLVEAPGIEYMTKLIRKGQATLVRTPREMAAAIQAHDCGSPQNTGKEFFRPDAWENTCAAIAAITQGNSPVAT